jgi:hypothetical protein
VSAVRITALDVVCPSCGATVGARCQQLGSSRTADTAHQSRRVRAKRLDDQLHPEHTDGQLPLWGKR